MATEVTISKKARRDFENILNYIKFKFGDLSATKFKNLVLEFLTLIESFPGLGTLELKDKNILCAVIHKRLKVYYQIKPGKIIILRLYDTRQSPDVKF